MNPMKLFSIVILFVLYRYEATGVNEHQPSKLLPKASLRSWCCANDLPAGTIQRTKIGKEVNVLSQNIVIGYEMCKNSTKAFATNKPLIQITIAPINVTSYCPVYGSRYRQEIKYFIETYNVPDSQSCPDKHIKCCNGFINLSGNCYTNQVIEDNYDLFVSLGMIKPEASIG